MQGEENHERWVYKDLVGVGRGRIRPFSRRY